MAVRQELRFDPSVLAPKVKTLVEQYQLEKMPTRYSTSRVYKLWLKNYILPQWAERPLTELQPRPVELWLSNLELSPKSRGHIRGLLHTIWDYAMWSGAITVQVNPISLVTVKGSSKRTRQPRSLKVEEFQRFLYRLQEPFRTMALICVCFGLRISECLALRWSDVDWLNAQRQARHCAATSGERENRLFGTQDVDRCGDTHRLEDVEAEDTILC